MQTISDLLHSLIESSKERIKTPITGAFICSFFIYNWRPIFLLLFSDTNIEYKIAMIDHEYCTLGAILWPLALAFIYTLVVPLIMLVVDEVLTPVNKRRIYSKYKRKFFEAERETELKNILSGNRDHQELLDRIKLLEESNIQRADADKNTIASLNSKLNESNKLIEEFNKDFEEINMYINTKEILNNNSKYAKFYNSLTRQHREDLKKFNNDENYSLSDLPIDLIKKMRAESFLNNNIESLELTEDGSNFLSFIRSLKK